MTKNQTTITLPSEISHFRGKNPSGPNVLILGGTHGDELTGVEVVRELLRKLGGGDQPAGVLEREDTIGNLFIGFGNPAAMALASRGSAPDRDLNRTFLPSQLVRHARSDDFPELQRARELAPLLRQIDFLFDIHGTSSPSKPFICFGRGTTRHFELCEYFPVDTILTDPDNILVKDIGTSELGTTDFFVNTYGGSDWSITKYGQKTGIGLCYETGLASDLANVNAVVKTLVSVLLANGSVNNDFAALFGVSPDEATAGKRSDQNAFRLTACAIAKADQFTYAPGMDRGWQAVKPNQEVGRYANGTPERVPTGGMYLFPKAASKITTDRSLYYLAQPASDSQK